MIPYGQLCEALAQYNLNKIDTGQHPETSAEDEQNTQSADATRSESEVGSIQDDQYDKEMVDGDR